LKDKLFNELNELSNDDKTYLLCRIFGLMETYEDKQENLSSEQFFNIIKDYINNRKLRRK